nr:MAG TPA: hypothetical protein [Caudoviricetes sp.]
MFAEHFYSFQKCHNKPPKIYRKISVHLLTNRKLSV